MIFGAITAKFAPYLAVSAGILAVAMLATIGFLWQSRDALKEQVGTLEQANIQLAQSAREQAVENAQLNAELDRRDDAVTRALRARQAADRAAQAAQDTLQEALADDACANTVHPNAMTDSLRKLADYSDKDSLQIPPNLAD